MVPINTINVQLLKLIARHEFERLARIFYSLA
jgi:hypothetical protein